MTAVVVVVAVVAGIGAPTWIAARLAARASRRRRARLDELSRSVVGYHADGQPIYQPLRYEEAFPLNLLAVASVVLAVLTLPAAALCGHLALSQVHRNGERGEVLAIAGLVIGYFALLYWGVMVGVVLKVL